METLVVVKQFPTLFFENLDLIIKLHYLKQIFFFQKNDKSIRFFDKLHLRQVAFIENDCQLGIRTWS